MRARGIGAATVLRLAATGWRVVATDRCEDDERLPYPLGRKEELDAVAEHNLLGALTAVRVGLPVRTQAPSDADT